MQTAALPSRGRARDNMTRTIITASIPISQRLRALRRLAEWLSRPRIEPLRDAPVSWRAAEFRESSLLIRYRFGAVYLDRDPSASTRDHIDVPLALAGSRSADRRPPAPIEWAVERIGVERRSCCIAAHDAASEGGRARYAAGATARVLVLPCDFPAHGRAGDPIRRRRTAEGSCFAQRVGSRLGIAPCVMRWRSTAPGCASRKPTSSGRRAADDIVTVG